MKIIGTFAFRNGSMSIDLRSIGGAIQQNNYLFNIQYVFPELF